jgi:hypothetical protein
VDDVRERGQASDDLADIGSPVEGLATIAVAIDAEHELWCELRIAIEHAARAEVRPTTRPHRADARGREHGDDRFGRIRQIGHDTIATCDAERTHAGREHAHPPRELGPRQRRQRPTLGQIQQRVLARTLVPQRVLRVVERGAREPFRTRHDAFPEHARRRRRKLHAAEFGNRAPERVEVGHRPAPERLVAVEGPAALSEPAQTG